MNLIKIFLTSLNVIFKLLNWLRAYVTKVQTVPGCCPQAIHFFVKLDKFGVHISMSLQRDFIKLCVCAKFGMINRSMRMPFCQNEKYAKLQVCVTFPKYLM